MYRYAPRYIIRVFSHGPSTKRQINRIAPDSCARAEKRGLPSKRIYGKKRKEKKKIEGGKRSTGLRRGIGGCAKRAAAIQTIYIYMYNIMTGETENCVARAGRDGGGGGEGT